MKKAIIKPINAMIYLFVRFAADDNPMKLMSIAMKPLCLPPFPIERIEEMTKLMGGDGNIK